MESEPVSSGTTTRRSWVRQIMGMPVSIHLRGTVDDIVREAAVEAAFAELREVDRIFSTYRADSEVARLRSGALGLDECSPTVRSVLDLCEQASNATGGYFTAWLPGPDGAVRFDPSGLVKGWAVERAASLLATTGNDDYYLCAGGDIALAVRGNRPSWRVAVEDPRDVSQRIAVLHLAGGGVATSGTAHRGAHIADPVQGGPAVTLASITVVGPSLMWADVFATAACARGADELPLLEWPPGYSALAVTADGRQVMTDGMADLLFGAAPHPS
jgi:thiamine biosynthesis lipoprotein